MSDFENMDEWDIEREQPRRRPSAEGRAPSARSGSDYARRHMPERSGIPSGRDPRGNRQPSGVRNRRRQKQLRRRRIILTIVLTLAVVALIGAAAYIIMQHLPSRSGTGGSETVYERDVDVTDAICGNMAVWLSTIDGENIDTAWVRDRCDEKLTVVFELTLSKDGDNKTYSEALVSSSFDKLSDKVDSVLDDILSEIVAEKLVDAGYAESVQPAEAQSLAQQILGMSTSEYIRENGVNLVPTADELVEMYSLGEGTYRISKGQMNFSPDDGKPFSETVLQKKDMMILIDSNIVYQKAE